MLVFLFAFTSVFSLALPLSRPFVFASYPPLPPPNSYLVFPAKRNEDVEMGRKMATPHQRELLLFSSFFRFLKTTFRIWCLHKQQQQKKKRASVLLRCVCRHRAISTFVNKEWRVLLRLLLKMGKGNGIFVYGTMME